MHMLEVFKLCVVVLWFIASVDQGIREKGD